VLAAAAYAIGNGRTSSVRLKLTTRGLKVLAQVKHHPITEDLVVSVRNVKEADQAVMVS
jgi:hypothetical protein